MRKKKLLGNSNTEIVFDGDTPMIKLKSELDLKIDYIKKLNKEIGKTKGFLYGLVSASILYSIIGIILLGVFL